VLCTYGIISQIYFYKYHAALPLYNRFKIFKAPNIRQIMVPEGIKGAEHHNICRLMFFLGIKGA
jgi:hypothetical protein